MQRTSIAILTASTLAFGLLWVVQRKEIRTMRERAREAEEAMQAGADLREKQSARLKELERANKQLDQQVQELARTNVHAAEAPPAEPPVAPAEPSAGAKNAAGSERGTASGAGKESFGKGLGEMVGKIINDPSMLEIVREQQKTSINTRYAGLFRELNLSSEEKDQLQSILLEAQMNTLESARGFLGENKEEDMRQRSADAKAQTDAEIKALLGEERFARYDEYQKNINEHMQLDQFKTKMAAQDMPLQDQQIAQLMQVMNEEKAAAPPILPMSNTQPATGQVATAENVARQSQWIDDYNRRVYARAGTILSPDQLKQFQQFQKQQAALQKFGLNIARQMFGGGKAAAPAAAVQ